MELRIEELIKEQGLTWGQLTKISTISKSTLYEIKNGQKKTLNPDQERDLAKVFNVTIAELYKEKIKW